MHNHGYQYRAKAQTEEGQTEHSDWFATEDALRDAMTKVNRRNRKYYCERGNVRCDEQGCNVDETAEIIGEI